MVESKLVNLMVLLITRKLMDYRNNFFIVGFEKKELKYEYFLNIIS